MTESTSQPDTPEEQPSFQLSDYAPIGLTILAIAVVANLRKRSDPKPKEACKLHKWDIEGEGDQTYMRCTQCGLLPESGIHWSLDKMEK